MGNGEEENILSTLGSVAEYWKLLVSILYEECKLTPGFFFQPYVFPSRTITFKYGKKIICKFGIGTENLSIRLPLSYEIAKELISKRNTLPQSNIESFEWVSLCKLGYSTF